MTDPIQIGFLLVNLLAIVVAVAGAILFGIRLRDRARTFGVVGCVLLILTGLSYTLLQLLPTLLPGSSDAYEVFGPISLLSGLLQTVGLALIIVAAVSTRPTPTSPSYAPPPYPGSYGPPPGSNPGPPPRW